MKTHRDVLDFWFIEHGQEDWFGGKPEFDALLAEHFADTHARVAMGEAWRWRETTMGRLAEVIVLDQFSRQLYRGTARAFAQDPMALTLAQEAEAQGLDRDMSLEERTFLYLPYMHSESLVVHEEAMRLFSAMDNADILDYEIKHRDCIARFGRFPFRNAALGRASTPEELAYIEEAGERGF
ncbi:DUF924 family protein [Devosia nitrariae]|uniref:Membrane protein n=1 Tax=Devosia nitrariae TaxID=2071872 RepID=A0ABQ5W0D7_9HYPH|nr:DUF924 family protein [Devosia nitrariae]GLQ53206.1 membrane protein [Devosia nitrariae]